MMYYLYFIAGLSSIGIARLFYKTKNGRKEIIRHVMIWTFTALGIALLARGCTIFINPDYLIGYYDTIGSVIILIPSVVLVVTYVILKTYRHR